jgi:hypothetical protein
VLGGALAAPDSASSVTSLTTIVPSCSLRHSFADLTRRRLERRLASRAAKKNDLILIQIVRLMQGDGGSMPKVIRLLTLHAIVWLSIPAAQAGQFLVVTHTAAGAWAFQDVESISVNGKDKLRSGPLPAGTYDSKAIGKLAEVHLSAVSLVRRTAAGLVLSRTSGTANWQLLLPEDTNTKVADTAAKLWAGATLTVKADRKDKATVPVRLDELYAIIPTRDASASAALLATDIGAHQTPGVEPADAFRQLIALLPAAVKAYPDGAVSKTVSEFLSASLLKHLQQWQEGDAPITVLDDSLLLAGAADAAFPKADGLALLSESARTMRKALDRKIAILRALAAGQQSDAFLTAYRDFEVYDKSFPDLARARISHMRASAASHVQIALTLQANGDYVGAIRHLLIARWRDPKLKEPDELLENVRLEAARLSVQRFAETRRGIDPRSPLQVQLQRKLLLAEQQLSDGKVAEAEKSLHEAELVDKDEPRLTLLQARFAVARGDQGKALALLDNFDGIAISSQDFVEGEKLRASVQYTIQNSLSAERTKIESDLEQQRFAAALEWSADGLKLDNENPDFLYFAAVNSCVLRHCATAEPLLRRFLEVTDSSEGNREHRLTAMQLLGESVLSASDKPEANAKAKSQLSWFSGAPLEQGVFYDPVSLSFQNKVTRIDASDHLSVLYEWGENQLKSVHVKHEEKQTGGNIARLIGAAAASAGGISSTLNWKTAARETNDFYFNYYDDVPQILKVSKEYGRVESRRIPISIPGVGIYGPFAGVGALGALSNIGKLGALSKLGGIGGLAGGMKGLPGLGGAGGLGSMPGGLGSLMSMGGIGGGGLGAGGMLGGGIGGAGNSAILSRLAGSGRLSGISGFTSLSAPRPHAPAQNYSVVADPKGGAAEGFLTLWNGPRLDTRIAFKVTGKRAAVGFSGNKFFHPFAWDGIHLFELDYDDEGRVVHAWEMDVPNSPRLDFTWEDHRLMKVTAHDESGATVYSRSLSYSADRLTAESITGQGGSSHIEYKYDKQGHLQEAVADADHTLDGRSRKVFFFDEDKGKH